MEQELVLELEDNTPSFEELHGRDKVIHEIQKRGFAFSVHVGKSGKEEFHIGNGKKTFTLLTWENVELLLQQLYIKDELEAYFMTATHPKRDALFEMAWEIAHGHKSRAKEWYRRLMEIG